MGRKGFLLPLLLVRKISWSKQLTLIPGCRQVVDRQCIIHTKALSGFKTDSFFAGSSISSKFSAQEKQSASFTTTINEKETMSSVTATHIVVEHNAKKNFFLIKLSGHKAKLEYAWLSSNLVDMYHTGVPSQFQGQGIAKHLAKAAFDHFSDNDILMRPTCTYLQKYLKDNPLQKYLDHVEKDFQS